MNFLRTSRMKASLLCGVVLGVLCIIGVSVRSGGTAGIPFLFALWFNRLLMGMVIGAIKEQAKTTVLIVRGALVGLLVSFAFFSAAGFSDWVSFLAGIVYGVIIELFTRKYAS